MAEKEPKTRGLAAKVRSVCLEVVYFLKATLFLATPFTLFPIKIIYIKLIYSVLPHHLPPSLPPSLPEGSKVIATKSGKNETKIVWDER